MASLQQQTNARKQKDRRKCANCSRPTRRPYCPACLAMFPALSKAARKGARMSGAYWSTLVAGAFDRDRHRPQTQTDMADAVRDMAARGLTDHTIAAATRLSVEQVRRLLGSPNKLSGGRKE